MAPNKFDPNRTPGIKPGLKKGDIVSDLSIINTNDDIERIRGAMLTFDSFVRNGPYFGVHQAGSFLHTTDIILGDEEDKALAPGDRVKNPRMTFVATMTVNEDMCNKFGIMHGACAAYLLDSVTTAALVCLEGPPRVSVCLNVSFFRPAPLGTNLKLIGYSTSVGTSPAHTRGEIWDADKSILLMDCKHIQVDPMQDSALPPKAKMPTATAKL
ncbi:hypothetical protein BS47DRAFT_1355609 [Hydnum rufescens UP504]|uniref:Thioesterase domain-containing protein n=1 Tax=Hydnum rufescens UP504 TaxID=1448309 RepID=A0A9P6AE42_9AGAM|nr:hypothetical protein BS47DRAFT_1355609 [Hydnum rufescens UP504]